MTAAPPDSDLLADYVRTGSKAAFEQIVSQYIHLVHAAAMRQVRDTHLAEDITQAVFLLFWQRAASLQPHGSLAGWLLVTTHHVSRNAIKKEMRLKQREEKVAQMKTEQETSPAGAESVLPLLDAAMAQLRAVDRDAIVERFFNSRSLEEVGATLGVSQQAAAKRISRAMERLRNILARHGITTSESALGALLPAIAQHPGASSSLLSNVLACRAGATPTASARTAPGPKSGLLKPLAAAIVLLALGGIIYLAVVSQGTTRAVQSPQVATPQPAAAPALPPQIAGPRTVTILLVDAKTKTPLPGGQVELQINGNPGTPEPAGSDGRFVLNLPTNFQYIDAVCRVPGRATMSLEFQNITFKGDLPTEFPVPMEKGTTIGGIVTDDIGNPLPGAKVRLSNFIDGNADAPRMWLGENLTTNADGKWHFENAPSNLDQLYIEVTHHDYSQPGQGDQRQADKLRNGTFETVMRQNVGHQITGVVFDPNGKPVSGAKVVIAFDRYDQTKPATMTDTDGKFAVSTANDEFQTYATVTAKGFAPEQALIQASGDHPATDAKPLEIHLKPPVILQGSVVDPSGKPVRGATVEVEKWRGNRALKWSTKTDSTGQFTWNEAPADVLQLNVHYRRMADVNGVEVTPGGAPVHLTIYPPVKIVGNVVDADTKAPIQAFRIVYGNRWTGQEDVTWQTQDSRKLGNGKYEANIAMFSNGGELRIEADGYLPAVSRMIQGDEGSIRIDFELKKGTGPTGVVLSPDGKPVADITVMCMQPQSAYSFDLDQDGSSRRTDVLRAQTDKDGRFSFQPQEKKYVLLVAANQGFAFLKDDQLTKDGNIDLQKWARIEGDYRLNAGPAKFAKIFAQGQYPIADGITSNITSKTVLTDANGHFVLDQVPPDCNVYVSQLVPLGSGSERFLQIGEYPTTAGQTVTIQVGGKGRPVIAKLSLPPGIAVPANFSIQLSINQFPGKDAGAEMIRQLPFPEDFPDRTIEQQQQWLTDQMKSHIGIATALATLTRQMPALKADFIVYGDGAIRADNVEPGTYRLQASLRPPFDSPKQDLLATATISFTVPMTPAWPTDEPLDVGIVPLHQPGIVQVGKPLPSVQLVTLTGQPIDQSTWAGKVVMLHLWDMSHRQFFPALQQLADRFRDNPNVMIVNSSMQMLPAWITHIATKDHLPGLLVMDKNSFDGNPQASYMENNWMMLNLPNVLVLDAHGNLSAKVTDPAQLAAAVDQAVGK